MYRCPSIYSKYLRWGGAPPPPSGGEFLFLSFRHHCKNAAALYRLACTRSDTTEAAPAAVQRVLGDDEEAEQRLTVYITRDDTVCRFVPYYWVKWQSGMCVLCMYYTGTGPGITSGVRVLCIRRAGLAVCVWVLFSSRALCVTGASSGPVGVVGSRCCAVALLPLTACPSCTVLGNAMSCAGALYDLLCLKVSLTPWSSTACSSPPSPSLRARRMSRHSRLPSRVRLGALGNPAACTPRLAEWSADILNRDRLRSVHRGVSGLQV